MDIVDKILMEAEIGVENIFSGRNSQRYSFIWRSSKYRTEQEQQDIINKLEDLRLKSGEGLPITQVNPKWLIATQDTVDSDKIKRMVGDYSNITALPMVVKLDGNLYALDGHHRSSVALIADKSSMNVRLADLDENDL